MAACYTPVYRPAPEHGVITRWVDGDTCEIQCSSGDGLTWHEKVRLYGVYAPEIGESGADDATKDMTNSFPPGSEVHLEYPERKRDGSIVWRDAFGRLLATISNNQNK